jgi:hypothetical protein
MERARENSTPGSIAPTDNKLLHERDRVRLRRARAVAEYCMPHHGAFLRRIAYALSLAHKLREGSTHRASPQEETDKGHPVLISRPGVRLAGRARSSPPSRMRSTEGLL